MILLVKDDQIQFVAKIIREGACGAIDLDDLMRSPNESRLAIRRPIKS